MKTAATPGGGLGRERASAAWAMERAVHGWKLPDSDPLSRALSIGKLKVILGSLSRVDWTGGVQEAHGSQTGTKVRVPCGRQV